MKRLLFFGGLVTGVLALAGWLVSQTTPQSSEKPRQTPADSSALAKPAGPGFPLAALSTNRIIVPAARPGPASVAAGKVPPKEPDKALLAVDGFANWAAQYGSNHLAVTVMQGEALAWKRREAMRDLIQTDPARALALAVPYDLRRTLPPQVTRFFEEQVDGRGDFKVAVGTDFSSGETTTFRNVELGGKNYAAFVYGRRQSQVSQTSIPLHGIALDGKMAVSSEPLRPLTVAEAVALDQTVANPADVVCSVSGKAANWRSTQVYAESGGGVLCFCGEDHYKMVNQQWALAESGGGIESGPGSFDPLAGATAANDAWTHGVKTVLYMRVNFPDDLSEPISEGGAYAVMDGVNTYYTENSYNLSSLTTTVTPLITLPQVKAFYSTDPALLLADARAAAAAAGYVTDNYDRDIVAFTPVPGYTFGGLAYVHGKGVWLQSLGVGVTAHELGHNYGLWHANFWDTQTNYSSVGPGTNTEYGNIYDTMGSGGVAEFNTVHKNILDWLKADATQVITSNGVYRLYPFDVPGSARVDGRMYAAAVRKDSLRNYWLEFRKQFPLNPWLQNGLLLYFSPWLNSNGGAQLVDTTPGSPNVTDDASREDAAIVIGRTFNDLPAGVHITPLQRGLSGTEPWIDYQVYLGNFPGNQAPVLAVEVDQTNVASTNFLVHFHATASDPDGDPLAYSWVFDDLKFSTNNLPWASKNFSKNLDHVVRCVVSDMKGGEASANTVVTEGIPAGWQITGRVTDSNGVPVEGVLVGNGSTDAATYIGGYTDSNGRYILANITNSVSLNAGKYGYVFSSQTNWVNPLDTTNATAGIDFMAVPATTVTVVADVNSVAENDGAAHQFTITRTGDTNNDLTVQISLSGTATLGSDYSLDPDLSLTNFVVIPAGSNSITVTFQAKNDALVEGPETATVTLLDDGNIGSPAYVLAPPAEATITILDDDAPVKPTVNVTTTTPDIIENGMDNGQLIFTRTGPAQNDLLVYYTVSGTATAGVDYTPLPGVVLIPAGQSSTTVPLTSIDDKNVEPDETVVATLTANPGYTVGSGAAAQILILDDDFMTVTVTPTSGAAAWPSTIGTFTVKRDGDLTSGLVVNYNVGGTAVPGVDYAALSGTLTIPAGAASTSIMLRPLAGSPMAGNHTVTISLTNSVNYDVGTPGNATLAILATNLPVVSVTTTTDNISEQGSQAGQFTISRTNASGDLTVYFAVSGSAVSGVDYVPLDNPVVLPDGVSSVTIDVIPFHDLYLEPTETVVLTLLPNSLYNVGSPASAQMNILDDGTSTVPAVGFCFATSAIAEGRTPGIAVSLSTTSAMPVMVDYRVIGGTAPASRYTLPQGTLTIPAGAAVGFVPLLITDDKVVEPAQTIRVALFNPVNATLDGIKIHTYTILDDDAAAVSVQATAATAAEAGLVAGNFRITRVGPTTASQLVNFQITGTASAPTDYAPLGNSAIIPAGSAFVDLPVIPVDDRTQEPTQTVVITLTSATNGTIASPNVATISLADNDTNTLPDVTVTSTNHPYAYEGGGNGQFLFTRSGPTDSALTVIFALSGTATTGADYLTFTNGVTIPAGQSNAVVSVVPVDDQLVEGDETVILSLVAGSTYRAVFPSSATVTIQDNDQRVWIDASDFTAAEPGTDTGEFTFSRFGTTNADVVVKYAIGGTASNGLDYVRISNSIVIPAGKLTVTLPILPIDDTLVEGPEKVVLTLQTDPAYTLATPTNATVTINDDEPMLTISAGVTNVLEGSGTNGVFRLTRTGDPKYDFIAHVAISGTATYGVDYPPFATNVYFTCGVTSIDLSFSPTNELAVEGDESVVATLIPDPAYTILTPSNAVVTIADAGTNQTPQVAITSPQMAVTFLAGTNAGLVLQAIVTDDSPTNLATWSQISGPAGVTFGDSNAVNTTVTFADYGFYVLRLTADDGQLKGFAEITVIVATGQLVMTNTLHWPFDEGAGTNAFDASGFGNDGVLIGAPTWTTNGAIAGALIFNGTNDWVSQVSGSNVLNGLSAFTVSIWVRPAFTHGDCGFVTADATGMSPTFSLATKAFASCGDYTNVVEAIIPTTAGVIHRASASNALKPNQWQHVALTWTNGEEPKLYFNGALDQPASGFAGISGVLTNCPQFIVGLGPAGSQSWNGSLDDVRVYPRALTAEEIITIAGFPATNHAPVVDAGPDVSVQIGVPVTLTGTVTDDGLPNPPAQVTNVWTYLGTNSNVTIADPSNLTNTFVFSDPGDYTFRLTAGDGQIITFDEVTITVLEPTMVSVAASDGDASELGPDPGEFTLTRVGDTNELTVYLGISGTASNGVDYVEMTNVVTFAAGSNTIILPLTPILDDRIEGDEMVTLTVLTNIAYSVSGDPASAVIHDSPYGLWSIQNFTLEQLTFPNISGAAADFDHDGIANFVEYAFNLDPKAVNPNPSFQYGFENNTNDGLNHLTFTFTRRLPPTDVAYGVFVSNDLRNWNTGTNYVRELSRVNDANGFTETVKAQVVAPVSAASSLFMQIRVWLEQVPVPSP